MTDKPVDLVDATATCSMCGETKSLSDFCLAVRNCNGHTGHCLACNRVRYRFSYRAWQARNRERCAAARKRYRKPHESRDRWRRESRTAKAKARTAVNNALTAGKIRKPGHCDRCWQRTPSRRLHGHHPDYNRPLVVTWLCTLCHGLVHRI